MRNSADRLPEVANAAAEGASPGMKGPGEASTSVSPSPRHRLWLWFCGGGFSDTEGEAPVARVVAGLLVGALCLAIGLLLVGVVLVAIRGQETLVSHTAASRIPEAIVRLESGGFFDLGLVLLLATPLARVVVLTGLFAWRRVWIFATMGMIVLVMLGAALLLGLVSR